MKASGLQLFQKENRPRRDNRLLEIAKHYREKYDAVIIPLDGENKPLVSGWSDLKYKLTDAELDDYCTRVECESLGVRNDSLTDVDLDHTLAVEMADLFLPDTLITGRTSRPRSHYFYQPTDEPLAFKAYKAEAEVWQGRRMIVELRSGRDHYTLLPGVAHKSGEMTSAEKLATGKPMRAIRAPDDLARRVAHLAACCVLVQHWHEGVRDEMAAALVAVLYKAGYDVAEAGDIIDRICSLAGDEERHARASKADKLYPKLAEGSERRFLGLPTLKKYTGDDAELIAQCFGDRSNEWPEPINLAEGDAVPKVPKDAVPSVLYNRAADIAERTLAPIEMPLLGQMCETAYSVGSAVRIALKTHTGDDADTFTQPLIFFGYVAMPSGSGKSPAMKQATQFLTQQHRDAQQLYKDRMADRARIIAQNAELPAGAERQPVPDQPELEIHKINDATIEAIIQAHDSNPRGMMLCVDELSMMVLNAGKYTGGRSTDEQQFCSMYDAGEINKIRVGEKASFYRSSSCVQIFGGIQPGVLPTLITKDNKLLGLAARFNLCAIPELPAPKMVDKAPRADFKERYMKRLKKLRDLFAPFSLFDEGVYLFTLDREAQRLFNQKEYELLQETHAADEPWRSHVSKYRGLLGRIALLWHLCTCDLSKVKECDSTIMMNIDAIEKIDADTMQKAITFLDYLAAHARKIYRITDMQDGEVEGRALARMLIEDYQREGRLPDHMTCADVMRRNRSDLKSNESIQAGALWLESRSWCEFKANYKQPGKRGRPSDRIEINPKLELMLMSTDDMTGDGDTSLTQMMPDGDEQHGDRLSWAQGGDEYDLRTVLDVVDELYNLDDWWWYLLDRHPALGRNYLKQAEAILRLWPDGSIMRPFIDDEQQAVDALIAEMQKTAQ